MNIKISVNGNANIYCNADNACLLNSIQYNTANQIGTLYISCNNKLSCINILISALNAYSIQLIFNVELIHQTLISFVMH